MKKIFAISDIHGHYTETIKCLTESGWDETNSDHLLIVCGDIFDRGEENVAIFEWLYRLTKEGKAIVIRGNHDSMLIDFLEWSNDPFNYCNNGTCTTIDDFLGRTRSFESYCLIDQHCETTIGAFANYAEDSRKEIKETYPDLLPWLQSLPWYYETKNYIFAHGAIDTQATDWKQPHCAIYNKSDWDALTWDDGSFLGKRMYNTDNKAVVVGHFHTYHLRHKYGYSDISSPYDDRADHSILDINNDILGHKIFIDGCTPLTKKVNVLVIEDKLLEEKEREEEN